MRDWVYQALCAVLLEGAYSNLYLRDHLSEVPEKDRALASTIFYGTLQNYAYCEACWAQFAKRMPKQRVAILLTMSVYQMKFLDRIPEYAILDSANKIARKHFENQRGFINAILRKTAAADFKLPDDPVKALALQYSLPEWLVKMWVSQYGLDKAKEAAAASCAVLPVYVRVNPGRMHADELAQLAEKGDLVPEEGGLYIWKRGSIADDPLYRQGKVSVQDPGSYAIAGYVKPFEGANILDMCAAPGTKSMAMAEMMKDEGSIVCQDLHAHRAALIASDARRLHLKSIHPQAVDSAAKEYAPEFDRVLCDVPCSGYGVLARKPDLKHKISSSDMDTLIPLQQSLLEKAGQAVKEGGMIVYSTCTLNKKENEKQVEQFLKKHPDFAVDEMQTLFPNGKHDGFFMARLKKQAAKPASDEKETEEAAKAGNETSQPQTDELRQADRKAQQ